METICPSSEMEGDITLGFQIVTLKNSVLKKLKKQTLKDYSHRAERSLDLSINLNVKNSFPED